MLNQYRAPSLWEMPRHRHTACCEKMVLVPEPRRTPGSCLHSWCASTYGTGEEALGIRLSLTHSILGVCLLADPHTLAHYAALVCGPPAPLSSSRGCCFSLSLQVVETEQLLSLSNGPLIVFVRVDSKLGAGVGKSMPIRLFLFCYSPIRRWARIRTPTPVAEYSRWDF